MALQRSEQRTPQRVVIRTSANRYDYDKSKQPAHMDYGWKRMTIAGQEDTEHLINCDENGWLPVPPERHPELAGRRTKGSEIVRGGLVLMERPKEITEEARNLDKFAASHQVASQVQRLGLEGKTKVGKGISKPRFEQIPEDE
jgi:hypothetical protein